MVPIPIGNPSNTNQLGMERIFPLYLTFLSFYLFYFILFTLSLPANLKLPKKNRAVVLMSILSTPKCLRACFLRQVYTQF